MQIGREPLSVFFDILPALKSARLALENHVNIFIVHPSK